MKIGIIKIISAMLALCILLASASCFIGLSALAEEQRGILSGEDLSSEDESSEDASSEDASSEDASSDDTSSEDESSEDESSEDTSSDDDSDDEDEDDSDDDSEDDSDDDSEDEDEDDDDESSNTSSNISSNTSSNTSSNNTSNDDAIVRDESKKVMLKQENYKIREWQGEMKALRYQNFNFVFGNGNGKIKPETTYIFSVEYYADPGEYGMGVHSSCVAVRTTKYGAAWGGANKDMIYNEDLGKNAPIYTKEKGRHKLEFEFTTYARQDTFYIAFLTGTDGDAYFWDFKLVEKGGDGTNLIKHDNFYGEWQDYVDAKIFRINTDVSSTSFDGLGSYSFVPFNKDIANLPYGEILELDEDDFDFDLGDDEDFEDEELGKDGSDEDIAKTGDASNVAVSVMVLFLAVITLAGTSIKIFKEN